MMSLVGHVAGHVMPRDSYRIAHSVTAVVVQGGGGDEARGECRGIHDAANPRHRCKLV